jgi:hypothetical protein
VFTGIWNKFILLIPSEENHENPRALEGVCVHWPLKKVYTAKFTWGKSRESQGLGGSLWSLAFEESLYYEIYLRKITRISGAQKKCVFTGIWRKFILLIISEENHENPRDLERGRVHWHLKKVYIANYIWGKSQESPGLGGSLWLLAFEEGLYC